MGKRCIVCTKCNDKLLFDDTVGMNKCFCTQCGNSMSINEDVILNSNYVLLEAALAKLSKCRLCVKNDTKGSIIDVSKSLESLVKEIDDILSDYVNTVNIDNFKETSKLVRAFYCYIEDILRYKKCFAETNDDSQIRSVAKQLKFSQNRFIDLKGVYNSKNSIKIDSIGSLINIVLFSLDSVIEQIENQIDHIKSEAKNRVKCSHSLSLSSSDEVNDTNDLPTNFCLAQVNEQISDLEIYKSLGIDSFPHYVTTDLVGQGNVIVEGNLKEINDVKINEYIIAYILRYIESFPLGSVNVHIFSKNPNYIFERLSNGFQKSQSSDAVKNIIQIHSSINDLNQISSVFCTDVFNKTGSGYEDLFSLHKTDQSDPFNLIVLRDGLVDGNGYASTEVLDVIEYLTDPKNKGHKCGLRFLIIDGSKSLFGQVSERNRYVVESIINNCEVKLKYDKAQFFHNDSVVEVLHIDEDMMAELQNIKKNVEVFINLMKNLLKFPPSARFTASKTDCRTISR